MAVTGIGDHLEHDRRLAFLGVLHCRYKLGMHIVYNLVTQALGGAIHASSREGGGAEFLLSFPD